MFRMPIKLRDVITILNTVKDGAVWAIGYSAVSTLWETGAALLKKKTGKDK